MADIEVEVRLQDPDVTGDWDTFDDAEEDLLQSAEFGAGRRIIEFDGSAVGSLSCIQVPYGPNRRSLAWRIGVTVLPQYRGRGIGSAAQRLLAEELLATSDANRVEADTDVGNVAEQRALEKAGFVREGVARGAQWRMGAWHDRVLYGFVRVSGTDDASDKMTTDEPL
jgi:RimJ/RimL family protein N-acetyltransferase